MRIARKPGNMKQMMEKALSKTKIMVVTEKDLLGMTRIINSDKLEQANFLSTYVGVLVNSKCQSNPEIISGIKQTRRTFINMCNFLINK